MQEVFSKIIEELEIERTTANNTFVKYEMNVDLGRVFGLEKAIEIVKQEAEKFGTDTNVGSNRWISCSERLPEMNPVDVIKEGAYPDCLDCLNTYGESGSQCCYGTEEQCSQCDEVMMEWEKLWNSTIKKSDFDRYGWDANPWVWVIEFERCEKPEGWCV